MSSMMDSSVTTEVVEKVQEQTNFFIRFLNQIDWRGLAVEALLRLLQLVLIVLILMIVKKIGDYFINTQYRKYLTLRVEQPNRVNTLYSLTSNIFQAVLWFFFVYSFLSLIGIPVGTLLAGAGVLGLAFSLGAQDFVSDIVNGFFILLEKQLDVGDFVTLDSISGTVMDVNLKTTKIRDLDGTVHYVPNREITIVSNESREDMRVKILIPLAPDSDYDRIKKVLDEETDRLVPTFKQITEKPGPIALAPVNDDGHLGAQIIFFVRSGEQFEVKFAFLERYMEVLRKEELLPINYLRAQNRYQMVMPMKTYTIKNTNFSGATGLRYRKK